MRRRLTTVVPMLASVVVSAAFAQPAAPPRTDRFDGTWFTSLDCADTTDKSGLVKGYHFAFDVHVTDGRLDGQYGTDGLPSSVHFKGEVREGGVLEIRAEGVTGSNEYVVGRAARGTAYVYTMAGTVDGARGEATRREVRPCTALFTKKDPAAR